MRVIKKQRSVIFAYLFMNLRKIFDFTDDIFCRPLKSIKTIEFQVFFSSTE